MMGTINDDENQSQWNGPELTGENWNEILEYANAHPEECKYPGQQTTDIGMGTNGQPVNLDLWNYQVISNNCIGLYKSVVGCRPSSGYENANIVEGKIQGKVPQYIKLADQNEFYPVTSMQYAFDNCSNLVVAPEIPSGVTNMVSTFSSCSSLTAAPEIPSSVTNMDSTFYGCSSLTTAPEIPNSVTNMARTFNRCSSLTTAPEIPNSVTNMNSTFLSCSSLTAAPTIPNSVTDMQYTFHSCSTLTGNIIINASPSYYTACFTEAATKEGTNLIVSGTSTKLDNIIATKSENSNITKAEGL